MDKKEILNLIIQKIDYNYKKIAKAYETKRNEAIDAPGAMQSRHDTSGIEAAWLGASLAKRTSEIFDTLNILKKYEPQPLGVAQLGALVKMHDFEGNKYGYFILPTANGEIVEYNQGAIIVISPSAPLAQNMIGKKPGDEIAFGKFPTEIKYTIDEIF
jgi:transcription elongation GreA/GreB family factor